MPRDADSPGQCFSGGYGQRRLTQQDLGFFHFEAYPPPLHHNDHSYGSHLGRIRRSLKQGGEVHQRYHAAVHRHQAANSSLHDRNRPNLTEVCHSNDVGEIQANGTTPGTHQ
jgi:hypothetical protein